jgi:hypothetical protein
LPAGAGSSTSVASTQSAAPGPGTPEPMRTRRRPRTTAAGSPLGSRPTLSTWAMTPNEPYSPSTRGTARTRLSFAVRAASTAAWVVGSNVTGITMPGSRTASVNGSTGKVAI